MEINTDALAFGKPQIAAAVAIFLSTLFWAIFFGMTDIGVNDLFTFKLHIVMAKAFSVNMLLFLLTLMLPTAIMAGLLKKMGKANLVLVSMVSSLLALVVAMAFFPSIQSLWILAVFYIISVPVSIEHASAKYLELKKTVTARVSWAAASRTASLLSVALIILSISTIMPQHEQYLERFEDFFMEFAYGLTAGQSQRTISSGATEIFVEAQIETIDQVLETPQFLTLREKTDPDVIAFVLAANGVAQYLRSPEYKQQMEERFSEGTTDIIAEMDLLEVMKQQFPFIKALEEYMPLGMWLGLLHALSLAGLFSLVTMFICKPMAVAYGLISEQMLAVFSQETFSELEKEELNN